jgi:hypothetical protein
LKALALVFSPEVWVAALVLSQEVDVNGHDGGGAGNAIFFCQCRTIMGPPLGQDTGLDVTDGAWFDGAFARFCEANVPDMALTSKSFSVRKFSFGQSNPTFLITSGEDECTPCT